MQFGGKISAHILQKFGAEFRPALGELPHLLQIPRGKPCGPPRDHVHWTDEATIRTHIPDELSGTVRQDGLATQNRFSFPGNEDNRVRYLLTLFGQAERSAEFTAAQPLRLSGVGLRFQTTSCHRE